MKHLTCIFLLVASAVFAVGQGVFPPPATMQGTTAIFKDSNLFIAWASGCEVIRGYQQITDTTYGKATNGEAIDAIGKANGTVVSLGDSGIATLTFEYPIRNGIGYDFAVFENAFNETFLELAYVEVSSDGIHFSRFPSEFTFPSNTQVHTYGSLDATHIHNLAGKYQANYGVPFDLSDLPMDSFLNTEAITHVRIIDVIGDITRYSKDVEGRTINDPFPTPFPSGGFDLDAIGVIHNTMPVSIKEKEVATIAVYPNPTQSILYIQSEESFTYQCIDINGRVLHTGKESMVDMSSQTNGVYYLIIQTKQGVVTKQVFKN